jgi:hypothetical protein
MNSIAEPSPFHAIASDNYTWLGDALKPLLPQSLTILGFLEQAASAPKQLHVWSSCAPGQALPEVFAIFAFWQASSGGGQSPSRLFCSLESSDRSPSANEESFVTSFLRECSDACYTILEETVGSFALRSPLMLGSIHEKWIPCLQPLAMRVNPCRKFLLPPALASRFVEHDRRALSAEYSVGPLKDEDLDVVIANSHIPRKRDYLMSRAHQSVCIRTQNDDQAIAWCIVHVDGSIGTMHVIDDFKRRGLGTEIMKQIVELKLQQESASGSEHQNYTQGWNWVDVELSNAEGMPFYRKLPHWEEAWEASWVTLLPSVHTAQ